jgi:hypothetical protein
MEGAARAPEPSGRPEPGYGRPPFEDRHDPYAAYAERDRAEREAAMQREAEAQAALRDQRERRARAEHEYAQQLAQRNAQNAYNRPPEPREQTPGWIRPGYEPAERRYDAPPGERPPPPPPQQQQQQQQPQPATTGYEYPATTTAPQFGRMATYHPSMSTIEHRYGQAPPAPPPPSSMASQQHTGKPTSHYDRDPMERQRLAQQEEQRLRQQALDQQRQQQHQPHQHQHQQPPPPQPQPQTVYGRDPPNPQYPQQHESPQRRPPAVEESQPMQQSRSFLGVQELNRKGRASPLPQAVQGAQGQLNGPGGEPSIKNEFGRMFSGIGSGVGVMGAPSPITTHAQGMPFSNSGHLRREDLENLQDSPTENGHRLARSASRQGGGRRRRLKEEEGRDDESSNGRRTPSGSGRGGVKRAKTGHHHAPHQ